SWRRALWRKRLRTSTWTRKKPAPRSHRSYHKSRPLPLIRPIRPIRPVPPILPSRIALRPAPARAALGEHAPQFIPLSARLPAIARSAGGRNERGERLPRLTDAQAQAETKDPPMTKLRTGGTGVAGCWTLSIRLHRIAWLLTECSPDGPVPPILHNMYSLDDAITAFGSAAPPEFFCHHDFVSLPKAVICLVTIGDPNTGPFLTSPSSVTWKRPDFRV